MSGRSQHGSVDPLDTGQVYDTIGESFDRTRNRPWSFVEDFLEEHTRPGEIVLDIGCGNGRHGLTCLDLGMLPISMEISTLQLSIAHKNLIAGAGKGGIPGKMLFVRGDARHLPFGDSTIPLILAVAVIHHIRSRDERIDMMRETLRVLTRDGSCLISAWSMDHPRFRPGNDGTIPGVVVVGPAPGDVTVEWKGDVHRVTERYYHLYQGGELASEATSASARVVAEDLIYGNEVIIVERKDRH